MKTVIVDIRRPATDADASPGAPRDEYQERSQVPSDQPIWKSGVWAQLKGEKGGELSLVGGVEAQPTVTFTFDYYDVMVPVEGDDSGMVLSERMNFTVVDELDSDLGSFDIDRIVPDYDNRKDVTVFAIRKTLAV